MSDILKNFYKNYFKAPEDIILDNCKKFLSYKSMPGSSIMSSLSSKKKNKQFLLSPISRFNPRNHVKLKLVNLSKIIGRNRKCKILLNNAFSNNNQNVNSNLKSKYKTYDEKIQKNQNQNQILGNVIKKFEHQIENNIKKRKNKSAKQIENINRNINTKIIDEKVNLIIKELLSKENQRYKIKEDNSRNIYPLNKEIAPMKYIEYNMQNEPNNPKLYKSYYKQIKFLTDKKIRSFLIEGINDYNENLKKYRELNFEFFSRNNDNRRKFYQKKIKDIILKDKHKENKSTKYTNLKYGDLIYNSEREKFKNNYIKAYNEKSLNKSKNVYFKYISNNEIKKMISLDDKMKLAYSNSKNLTKYMKKDTVKKFRKKFIL